jgi:hypothetical protein
LEERESIGESGSHLILPFSFLQVKEVAGIQELAPFGPKRPSLLSLIERLLDVVCGIDSEVFDKSLAVFGRWIHIGSQFGVVYEATSAEEEEVEQPEDGDLPAIRIFDELLTIQELDAPVIDWIRDLDWALLSLRYFFCLHLYCYQVFIQQELVIII